MGPQVTIAGTVDRFGHLQINIRVADAAELRAFYSQHAPHRNLDWAQTPQPLFTVSNQQLVRRCRPGDHVEYLFELRPSKDGPRAWGLDLWVVG